MNTFLVYESIGVNIGVLVGVYTTKLEATKHYKKLKYAFVIEKLNPPAVKQEGR